MGLEPYEIAMLYKEKRGIMHAVKEAILALDQDRFITCNLNTIYSTKKVVNPSWINAPVNEISECALSLSFLFCRQK